MSLTTTAVTAAETAWNTNQVHEVGSVPSSPLTPYLVLSVTTPGDTNYRVGGRGGSQAAWTVVQAVGKNMSELDFAVAKADAAFLGVRLTTAATPARRDDPSTAIRDPDAGGLLTCTLVYRFAINP